MQFRTPQFIDVEDKIFGPFTYKQFLYLAGGAGICFLLYKLLPLLIAIIFMIPVAALSLALTFYRINNKPFIFTLQAYITYLAQSKLYIWKKEDKKEKSKEAAPVPISPVLPKVEDRLSDIAWSLDVLDTNKK